MLDAPDEICALNKHILNVNQIQKKKNPQAQETDSGPALWLPSLMGTETYINIIYKKHRMWSHVRCLIILLEKPEEAGKMVSTIFRW